MHKLSSKWDLLADETTINETAANAKNRGINIFIVENKEQALEKIKRLVPQGAEIMNGSSTTLAEIGFVDYLKSANHGWKNLHEEIFKESDREKQAGLRRKALSADYFLGSVNAISKNGELVSCDASGSRTGAYLFAAKNLVLVAGAQKITKNLGEAMERVREYAFPLEDERAKKAYGMGSATNKWAIIEGEKNPERIKLILVKEKLGF